MKDILIQLKEECADAFTREALSSFLKEFFGMTKEFIAIVALFIAYMIVIAFIMDITLRIYHFLHAAYRKRKRK